MTKEYPVVGIDSAGRRALNGNMNGKYLMLILMLCAVTACGGHHGPVVDRLPAVPRIIEDPPLPVVATPPAIVHPDPRPEMETIANTVTKRASKSLEDCVAEANGQLQDVFFPYDRDEVTPEGVSALRRDAAFLAPVLAEFPQVKLVVEGHCDERGSAEYNLGLGDHRAVRVAAVLGELGVAKERVEIVSYGKESPQCTEASESCWRRNRRAHLVLR